MGGSESFSASGKLRNNWPCQWSRDKTSLFFCIVPFLSKGSVRETKGNFGPWFPRQRSLLMAGRFQRAQVSGQYGFFLLFFFKTREQKRLMLLCKEFPQLLRWTDCCFKFRGFWSPLRSSFKFWWESVVSEPCLKQNRSENKLGCKILRKERVTSFKGGKVLGDCAACWNTTTWI